MDSHVPLRDALAGAFGAGCLVICGAPFDTVKLRVQARLSPSPIAAARSIFTNEGLMALWRGAGPAFASAVIENAVLFSSQGFLRRLTAAGRDSAAAPHPIEHVVLGAISGVFSATAICPAEVVKIRMQAQGRSGGAAGTAASHHFPSGWHCAAHILRNESPTAFFAGLRPLLVRDIPFNAIFMGSYRNIVQAYRRVNGLAVDAELPTHVTLISGGLAGASAWAVVFPADVLKSRAQVASSGPSVSMLATLRTILAEEGVRTLYRGCSASIARAIPANAALFWGVETSERFLKSVGI